MNLNEFKYGDKTLKVKSVELKVNLLKEKSGYTTFVIVHNSNGNDYELVDSYCKPDDLENEVNDCISFLYKEYAEDNSSKMTKGAQDLKNKMLEIFELV
jgi:hypothetical protein